jgi:hypothetical protein
MRTFLFLFFLPKILFASTLPMSHISSASQGKILLTNNAMLQVQDNLGTSFTWEPNDVVFLQKKLFPNVPVFNVIQLFVMVNLTRGFESTVKLLIPPTSVASDTFSIVSINHQTRMIVLSNGSQLQYAPSDFQNAYTLQPNRLVMLGKNSTLPGSMFDIFLFDVEKPIPIDAQILP